MTSTEGVECVFGCVLDLAEVEESALDEIVQDADTAVSLSAHRSFHAPVLGVVAGIAALVNFYVNPIVEVIDSSNFVDIDRQLSAAAGMQQQISSAYGSNEGVVNAAVDAGTRGAKSLGEALGEAMAFLRGGIAPPVADGRAEPRVRLFANYVQTFLLFLTRQGSRSLLLPPPLLLLLLLQAGWLLLMTPWLPERTRRRRRF